MAGGAVGLWCCEGGDLQQSASNQEGDSHLVESHLSHTSQLSAHQVVSQASLLHTLKL